MIIHQCQQGSEEWLQLRLGIPTASEFSNIIQPEFGRNYHCPACGADDNKARKFCAACKAPVQIIEAAKPSASAPKYMARCLAEWMAGVPLDVFEDQPPIRGWRERGKLLEPEAIRYYEMERDCETHAVGFITSDDGMIGASPDRLVGDVGLLEQKCPALETHVGYMLDPGSLVAEYRLQVQGQLWVCQREWCDMQSYYPGFPSVIVRVQRDDKVIEALEKHVPAFVQTMLACRDKLTAMYGELRRERLRPDPVEASRAAFDDYMESGIGGNA